MRVSSKELIRNFGAFSDVALKEPVVITKNGRDRLVLLSVEEWQALQLDEGADNAALPGREKIDAEQD
jgi:prevent-host-death family protein